MSTLLDLWKQRMREEKAARIKAHARRMLADKVQERAA